MEISIDDYNYALPDEFIAKYPVSPRDSSKLLVFKNGEISSSVFSSLESSLPKSAHLIFNNTKVIPARTVFQKKTGARIEIFLLEPISPSPIISVAMESQNHVTWKCIIGNKKKWKGEILEMSLPMKNGKSVIVKVCLEDVAQNTVSFDWDEEISFAELVKLFGQVPLPPYLNRQSEEKDKETYQTVYSELDGAVAAPTAGLHFTDDVLKSLKRNGIKTSFLTLHVGAGTFKPVKAENALDHEMHSEQMLFSKEFIEELAKSEDFIIPVGTTSVRSLESLYWYGVKLLLSNENSLPFMIEKLFPYQHTNKILPGKKEALNAVIKSMSFENKIELVGTTEIFIFPTYKFQICDGLITNFHQPKSTLLLLIAALIGKKWENIYDYAKSNNYRFLSYGDSSLLLP